MIRVIVWVLLPLFSPQEWHKHYEKCTPAERNLLASIPYPIFPREGGGAEQASSQEP